MRIALIHNRVVHRGGLETRLFSYIDEFLARGHKVSVVVSKISSDVTFPNDVDVIRVNLSYIPRPLRDYWFSRSVERLQLSRTHDFTLSLVRTPSPSAALAPGNHLGFLRAIGSGLWRPSDRLYVRTERNCFESCRVILAASSMMKNELVELYGLPESKIRVLFPPTDIKRFNRGVKSRSEECRLRFGCSPEKKTCAFVSVSHGRKGLPLLLDVFAQLRNEPYELLVAGEARMGAMPENVKYLGYLKETEQLYSAADAMLLPALYEPYGQVVSESLLCGTPVAVSHMVGAREVVTPSEGLIISDFEAGSWVNAVRDICSRQFNPNPDLAKMHRLSVQDHVSAMLGYWDEFRNV